MVIYFSGTGNSKFIASAIADKLGDELVSSNDYIKQNKQGDFCSEKAWVIVFPTYLSTIPEIMVDFLRKASITGAKDAYFVGTCASEIGASSNAAAKLCEEKGLVYKGLAKVVMPQNYIALFKMTEAEEIEKRQKEALVQIETIAQAISKGESLDLSCKSKVEYAFTRIVEKIYNGPFTQTKKFYATDECVGCSLCEKVCPLNNIELVDNKPSWKGSCIHCMGCINRCPKQAIEYGKNTIGKARYSCKEYGK